MNGDEITSLTELVSWMQGTGQIDALTTSAASQFSSNGIQLLGPTLLPERQTLENAYKMRQVFVGGEIGNSGADYSPAQINQGFGTAEQSIIYGKLDAATQLTGRDIEAIYEFIKLNNLTTIARMMPLGDPTNNVGSTAAMTGMISAADIVLKWIDTSILGSLSSLMEQQRWQAIVDSIVKRRGANGYMEDVPLPTPVGSRITVAASGTVAAPAGWYDRTAATAADALDDILSAKLYLRNKGYQLNRIISKTTIRNTFMRNGKVVQAALPPGMLRQVDSADLMMLMGRYELPQWETYDAGFRYRDPNNSSGFNVTAYLDRPGYDVIIMLAETNLSSIITFQPRLQTLPIPNTLGYFGLGRPPGQSLFGKVTSLVVSDDKYPPSIYGEVVAQGLPCIEVPDAIVILKIPKPV